MDDAGYCRELACAEPLVGTAAEAVTRWVLLEDGGPWGAKVPKETTLPDPVKLWLIELGAVPGVRVQLIRRPRSSVHKSTRTLLLIDAAEHPEQRREVELEVDVDRLPTLDVDALLAATEPGIGRPLWLVCTHGARDRCCAKWGMPVYDALASLAPERVWQASHLGGHRFAPTFLLLPQGLLWGRVPVERIPALWRSVEAGELAELDGLRGRCCYSAAVQAGELMLRRSLPSFRSLDGLTLVEASPSGPGRTRMRVRVEAPEGPHEHVLEVEVTSLDLATPGSCGDAPERRTTLRLV